MPTALSLDAALFGELAGEARLRALPHLDLAAGERPEAGQAVTGRASRQQHAGPVANHDGGRDLDGGRPAPHGVRIPRGGDRREAREGDSLVTDAALGDRPPSQGRAPRTGRRSVSACASPRNLDRVAERETG